MTQYTYSKGERTMDNMIVVGFHGRHRAAEVLDMLEHLNDDWAIDLKDAVAAYRRDNGKLRVEQSVQPTGNEGAGLGGALGLIVGSVLAAPFTAGVSTAVAATAIGTTAATGGVIGAAMGEDDATSWKERFGISDDFVQQVGGMIQPGDSAVFALVGPTNPETAAAYFAGYGGTILRTTLNPLDKALVQETIRAVPYRKS
jgi:uncharacterized membrane protein